MKIIWTDQKVRAEWPAKVAWRLNKLERIAEDAKDAMNASVLRAQWYAPYPERIISGITLQRLLQSLADLETATFDPTEVLALES